MRFTCEQCGYSTDVKCNYEKHLNRKTPCKPSLNSVPIDDKPIDEIIWKPTKEGKYECVKCFKVVTKRHQKHHSTICRGVPKDLCQFCLRKFNTHPARSQHQKICKKNPLNMPAPPPPPPQQEPEPRPYCNVQNNYNINDNRNYNTLNQIVQMHFGQENVDYLLHGEDPRYENAKRSCKDCVGLVHFNADHPENQTVRKTNKKSDLMEFLSEYGWEPEACSTGIPRMRTNLEHKLNTKFDDKLTDPTLRELLYHNSKRGVLSEDVLLAKYNDTELYNQMRCREEIEAALQNFKKDTLSKFSANNHKMPCVVVSLQRGLNEIRRKYNQPELTLGEVARSY